MNRKILLGVVLVGMLAGVGYYLYTSLWQGAARGALVWRFLRDPAANQALLIREGTRCGSAPFIFPTTGAVGFIWGDSFRPGHTHQGIDIFAGTDVGKTRVIAAYPGFLTRLTDWKSSLIMRVPDDPLHPGQQIWLYYTHMADRDGTSFISNAFPPGTSEVYVPEGTLLGYQGNYSGDPGNPVGVHLHFSIVTDDGRGRFKNELDIRNTLDPSPYLGLDLNAASNPDGIPVCARE